MIKKSHLFSLLLLLVLLSSLLPYRYVRSDFRLESYIIAVFIIIFVGFIFLLDSKILNFTKYIIFKSPLFLIYLFYILLSQSVNYFCLDSCNVSIFFWGFGYFFIGFMGYYVFPAVVLRKEISGKFFIFLILIALFAAIVGIYVGFTGYSKFLNINVRVVKPFTSLGLYTTSSIFFESNRFAAVLLLGIAGVIYSQLKYRNIFIFLFLIIIFSLGIIISWSRTVYGGFLIAIIFSFIVGVSRKNRIKVYFLMLFFVLFGIFLIKEVDVINNMLCGHGLSKRAQIWPAVIEITENRPLFGYGLGNSNVIKGLIESKTGFYTSPHSTPLSLAVSTGFFSVFLWFMVILFSIYRLFMTSMNSEIKIPIFFGIIGMFISSLTLSYNLGGASYGSFVFVIFLGLANTGHLYFSRNIYIGERNG